MLKMLEYTMKPGSQSKSVVFYCHETITTTDAAMTQVGIVGLTDADFDQSTGKSNYYRQGATVSVAMALVAGTMGTWVSGGVDEISATLMPGCYLLDIPNAALARGADWVVISLSTFADAGGGQVLIKIDLIRSLATG